MSEETEKDKPAAKKAPAKKPATRKAAAKKPAARKTAAKTTTAKTSAKTAAKKPATRKTAAKKPATPRKTTTRKPSSAAAAKSETSAAEEIKVDAAPSPEAADTPQGTDAGPNNFSQGDAGQSGNAFDADEFRREFKQKDWAAYALRGAFMILFGFLAWVAISVNFLLSGLQFIMLILTGGPNEFIRKTIMVLGRYIVDVMQYLSFESDDRPFPLGKDLPNAD